jgi:uncharacterized membrane protein YqiK
MIPPSLVAPAIVAGVLLLLLLNSRLLIRLFGAVMIAQNQIGIVNKKYRIRGANQTLPDGAIVALNGEAGWQADTLAPGLHLGYWPWQYVVKTQPFLQIPDDKIGIVEAYDGTPLPPGRVLGKKVDCDSFQNARAFLEGGGQRGPQIAIIPPGIYRINSALFGVTLTAITEIPRDTVGVVTTKEGKPLPSGEIAGKEVPSHNLFQDGQAFVDAGGFKGLQEQVILAGRYFLNPLFVAVDTKPMTEVPIATVGVVISYVGEAGKDVSGDTFKHGNLVSRGQKGVWTDPLDPGKYPINPYVQRVELVPTQNVVLNWANAKSEAHMLDKNLSTITVRSSDGFTFNLDVAQIIHIPRNDAPKVIARFGNMQNLVTQVLEPTIGNYFRRSAQLSDVIDFLKNRGQRQDEAKAAISTSLAEYNVNAVDTLIGDITPPADLMKTLTDRKIASQEQATFEVQRQAQEVRQSLEQAKAMADTQANVVASQRQVSIAEFNAQASVKTAEGAASARKINAEGEAAAKRVNGEADAAVTKVTGEATAAKTLAIGNAEAEVIKNKINSMEPEKYAAIEVSRNLASGGQRWVPEVMFSAGGNGNGNGHGPSGGGTIADMFMALLLAEKMRQAAPATPGTGAPGTAAGRSYPIDQKP